MDSSANQIISFPSMDGASTISAKLWLPDRDPKGIVQLVHGMAEHIGRYDDFAKYLAAQGYAVCGSDHIGHGASVESDQDLGHMPVKDGEDVLVEDVHGLRQIINHALGEDVPYFIFGHSMGSLVTRVYLSRYGEGLAGAVICGTAHQPLIVSKAGNLLARMVAKFEGPRAKSEFLHSLADGAYSKAIANARTPLDWLSRNEDNVDVYTEDPLTGFIFTAGGYSTLTALAYDAARNGTVKRIPKNLPLLFIAGEEDPVGDNGKGVRQAARQARKAGIIDVEEIIYPEMRHEILNEHEKHQVYADVLMWLNMHNAAA